MEPMNYDDENAHFDSREASIHFLSSPVMFSPSSIFLTYKSQKKTIIDNQVNQICNIAIFQLQLYAKSVIMYFIVEAFYKIPVANI